MTNLHTHKTNPKAEYSYNKGNFYGMLRLDFSVADPTVAFEAVDEQGKVLHRVELTKSQLSSAE